MALPVRSAGLSVLPVSVFRAWALMRMVPSVLPSWGRRATRPFLSVDRMMRWAALAGLGPVVWALACMPVVSRKLASPASMVKTTGTLGSRLSLASRTTADSSSRGWALVSAIWLRPLSLLILCTAPRWVLAVKVCVCAFER